MPNTRYGNEKSKYCYPGSNVLINHFDIKDEKQLAALESMFTAQRLAELQSTPITGEFDLRHLQKIHARLFSDLYPFAGEIRTENITKDGFSFAQARFILDAAEPIFQQMMREDWKSMNRVLIVEKLVYYMSEINVLHPFREGNGRSLREFIRCVALEAGYRLDWSVVPPEAIFKASVQSVKDVSALAQVISQSLTNYQKPSA
ncbi:cell filamentation protein Fic [Halobacillus litoralis]|uniref:protein adenylyltransferase n=1 Tax=Halobacillus litoralis TaxID=45668 RepID=A0A845F5E7_9BACI|nr:MULTISPECIES: Fic family protein [Halobacillus]MEC3882939.1 Fic family protein [Halobacillus sp. HZG1]MYL69452.1 cell filamentation protein Fic [Halobacillus litoralis]